MGGRLRDGRITTDLRLIVHLPHAHRRDPHESPEVGKCGNRGQRLEVTFEIRSHVPFKPALTISGRWQVQRRRRESAARGEIVPRFCGRRNIAEQFTPRGLRRCQEVIPTSCSSESELFTTGHGPQRQIRGATSQRFRDPLHEQQVR